MACPKCGGFLYLERFSRGESQYRAPLEFVACIMCGLRLDLVILHNRLHPPVTT